MQRYKVGDVSFSYSDDLGGDVVIENQTWTVCVPIGALVAFQNHCDKLLICGCKALLGAIGRNLNCIPCTSLSLECDHRDGIACKIGLELLVGRRVEKG